MAQPKKGTLCQKLFACVDKTDFATVESGVTSNFTTTYKGVNHGSAAASAGTVSKAISVVHSGIMRVTLKTTENNYDEMLVKIVHASCADQHLVWSNRTNDDTDVISRISDLNSNITSQVSDLASVASDAHSAAAQGNSRALVLQSRLSDVESAVDLLLGASHLSDFASRIATANWGHATGSDVVSKVGVLVSASHLSDLSSRIAAQTWTHATASDFMSDMVSRLSDLASAVSDAYSAATDNTLTASDMSDLRSAITAVTANVTTSDISDIASAVKVILASRLSDTLSHAQQANSRALILQSRLSDVESAIDAGPPISASDMSDLRSAITAGSADAVTASDVSDIASAVKVVLASRLSDTLSATQQTNSRALVLQSRLSDVESQIDAGVTLTTSALSDVGSRVWAGVTAAGANKVADHVLRRAVQSALDSSDGDTKIFRSPIGAVCKMVNKWSVDGTTLRIYEDDDTTQLGTQAVVADSDAEPIVGLDTN